MSDDKTVTANACSLTNNKLLCADKHTFRPVSSLDLIPVDLSPDGDCIFYMNTSEFPLTIVDRDGVQRVISPDRPSVLTKLPESDLRRIYKDSLIIVRSTVHDLSVYDNDINLNSDSELALEQIETVKALHRPQSDWERCYTSANRAFRKALDEQKFLTRTQKTQPGVSQFESNGRFVVAVFMVIKISDIPDENKSVYIEAADVTVRREVFETEGGRTRRLRKNFRPIIHPFSRLGQAYNSDGGLSAREPGMFVKMIRVIRRERKTADDCLYVIMLNKVERIPIGRPLHDEPDGVYITEKDEEGFLRETRHSFQDAKTFGVFEFEAEATAEQQNLVRKYISEHEQRIMLEEKQRRKEEEIREINRKNDAQRKSDAIRYAAQVFGAVAAFMTACVTLVKLFSTAKSSG